MDKNDNIFDVSDCCKYPVGIVQVPHLFVGTYVLSDKHNNLVNLDKLRMCRFHMVYIQLHHQDYMYQVDKFQVPILLQSEDRPNVWIDVELSSFDNDIQVDIDRVWDKRCRQPSTKWIEHKE
jgi:hypothetical protein